MCSLHYDVIVSLDCHRTVLTESGLFLTFPMFVNVRPPDACRRLSMSVPYLFYTQTLISKAAARRPTKSISWVWVPD